MKKNILILFVFIFGQASCLFGQNADPYFSMLMTPVLLSMNGVGTLYINTGNAGNMTIVENSLRIEINAGYNAEILGLDTAENNDSRWMLDSFTTGIGNKAIFHNTGGAFGSFDIGELFVSIAGREPSEPVLISGHISYVAGNNPALGGLPNSSQGNATPLNDYSQSSVAVGFTTEDCANDIDDDTDGFIDCQDADCSLIGIDGSYDVAVSPTHSSFCVGDSVRLVSTISNLPPSHPAIWYMWTLSDTTAAIGYDTAMTVKESGSYNLLVMNIMGCSLTVDSIIVEVTTIDPSVVQVDTVLTATMPAASYQWIDCDSSDAPIAGATNQVFIAAENGNYAVIISKNGCLDTSACYSVVNVGLNHSKDKNNTRLYPNPFSDGLYLEFEKIPENTTATIFSTDGKTISTRHISEKKTLLATQNLPKGIYFVKIQNDQNSFFYKTVKEF